MLHFQNQNQDPSHKMDLDFCDSFEREKSIV